MPSYLDADTTSTGAEAEPTLSGYSYGTWEARNPPARDGQPRGRLTGLRVKENGKSEGRPVVGWIGVASADNIILRESEQTSVWSFLTRKLDKQTQEAKQMTANTFAGAASHSGVNWRTIDWSAVHRTVRRLQARIVARP